MGNKRKTKFDRWQKLMEKNNDQKNKKKALKYAHKIDNVGRR